MNRMQCENRIELISGKTEPVVWRHTDKIGIIEQWKVKKEQKNSFYYLKSNHFFFKNTARKLQERSEETVFA